MSKLCAECVNFFDHSDNLVVAFQELYPFWEDDKIGRFGFTLPREDKIIRKNGSHFGIPYTQVLTNSLLNNGYSGLQMRQKIGEHCFFNSSGRAKFLCYITLCGLGLLGEHLHEKYQKELQKTRKRKLGV